VIIDDLNFACIGSFPSEDNPPLPIDSDAMEARKIPAQRLEAVTGRRPKVLEIPGRIEHVELL
jgi:hypothetical protein